MTGWSYRIGSVVGIDVKVHATFALIVAVAAAGWWAQGPVGMAFGAALVLLLFACILLHELGHALAARYYGVPVREIVLLPIGGIAFLGRAVRNPVEELVIAAAGPTVNVAILALLLPACFVAGVTPAAFAGLASPGTTEPSLGYALAWLASANIGLVLFNLIPAFPLDGGRMLRGALGLVTDWTRATEWATTTGRSLAVAMGVWAVATGHVMLALVAVLIFTSASSTAAEERGRTVLSSHAVGAAHNRHALVLAPNDRVSTVVAYLLTSYQPDFAVVAGTQFKGVVRRTHVLEALAARGGDLSVSTIMRDCPAVDATLSLAEVRRVLQESMAPVAAVYERGHFSGLVNLDDIDEAELVLASQRLGRTGGHLNGRLHRWARPAPSEA